MKQKKKSKSHSEYSIPQLVASPVRKVRTRKFYSKSRDDDDDKPAYSVKYIGVTKGQMGILTKRHEIPHISDIRRKMYENGFTKNI